MLLILSREQSYMFFLCSSRVRIWEWAMCQSVLAFTR